MKRLFLQTALMIATAIAFSSCDDDDKDYTPETPNQVEVIRAEGEIDAINAKLSAFREIAGNPVNATLGAKGGRREINWDGVPANLTNVNTFPADFFNPTDPAIPEARKRGLLYTPATAALRVSDNNFADIDPSYANEFKAFSPAKLFSASGTVTTDFKFQVPGTNQDAYVSSFGIIFSDVDDANATIVKVYEGNDLIAEVKATAADKKFSFVGITAKNRKITRVQVKAGNTVLAAGALDGGDKDVVVMDDFIYSEPIALK
ncbi:hypothetical protein OQY15_00110 [Pedobacter sp. MC2016-15]|uniref:hypothetical protein n=1 Tax=Pedobacter sp. MC2016-15 TaxID=2994473 RepID=UPI002246905C|nr:hypothetical protein [Pedobacter sp. MC2016-15]MCX2477470.1 hypothetical protein [Pedobacter sp. MC2016-15]